MTEKQIKSQLWEMYQAFIEELLFNEEYDLYTGNERQAFRVFINTNARHRIICNERKKEEILDDIVLVHDSYQDFCGLQGVACGKCPYKNTPGGKGDCFKSYLDERVHIQTVMGDVVDVLFNIAVGLLALVTLVGVIKRMIGQ